MDKELLILYGARFAVIEIINQGGKYFEKKIEDDTFKRVEYADICNYLTELIDKHISGKE